MAQTPPFRSRPNLHLSLSPFSTTSSPSTNGTPFLTPFSTPFATTTYSPFRSAGLKPPTPYGGVTQFALPTSKQATKSTFSSYTLLRVKRILTCRALLFLLILIGIISWWNHGWNEELDIVRVGVNEFGFGNQFFEVEATKDLQFFPAANPKIHYIGRWTSTPNRLRKDGTFPGVYFDINITNTSTLLLSLHNAVVLSDTLAVATNSDVDSSPITNPGHISFRPSSLLDKPARPVSLLARVDQEEYVLLPNSSALVSIRSNDLDPDEHHHIRIIAPMTDDHSKASIQFEGLWLSKTGKLLRAEGSLLDQEFEDEDGLEAESEKVGEKHRLGLSSIMRGNGQRKSDEEISEIEKAEEIEVVENRKKILEVITDNPGSLSGRNIGQRGGGADGLLAGVMGWEYLLGEMFNVHHVSTSADGMCLTQGCIGGVGEPSGMGDVFFRSGPYDSPYFEHPWLFQSYIPDVLILNLGGSDHVSFQDHGSDYNQTSWELSQNFEDAYVLLIRAIRQLAYPKHPSILYSERAGYPESLPNTTPASIPIFILRPFRGQLEHATQGTVNRLRADGDKSVFWLDTSGWLEVTEDITLAQDFFYDQTVKPAKWRLTEQGNQRVAIFLHMHVCRYLASNESHCAFLPPEVYQGKFFNPEEVSFDRYVEDEKERKLKKLFWDTEEIEGFAGAENV